MTENRVQGHSIAQALEHSLGMFVVTDLNGRTLYANEGASRRTGYAVAEIVGKKPGQLWGGHMPTAFYDHFWKTLLRGQPMIADLENRRKDGRIYAERVHIAPIMDIQKQTKFFIAAQPFHLDGVSLDSFGQEFRRFFGTNTSLSGDRFIGWMNRWFTTSQSDTCVSEYSSVAGFIENEFVSPLQERFSSREEDRKLIEAAQIDAQEFQSLYRKYESLVRQYFLRHLGSDRDMSEDLTQETFFRAFSSLSNFTVTNASYGTYLLRVAHNLLINHYRKKQPMTMSDQACIEEAGTLPSKSVFSEHLFDESMLSLAEKKILSLKYQEGFSIREIATLFGISENAAKLRLSRARKRLRKLLESRGDR